MTEPEFCSACYFCKKYSMGTCDTCQKSLCKRCRYIDHCRMNCEECRGKSVSYAAYSVHPICASCWSLPQPIAVFLHNTSQSKVHRVLYRLIEDNGYINYLPEDCVARGRFKAELTKISENGVPRILFISSCPANTAIPQLVKDMVDINAIFYFSDPKLRSCWVVYKHGDPTSLHSLLLEYFDACATRGKFFRSEDTIQRKFEGYIGVGQPLAKAQKLGDLSQRNLFGQTVYFVRKPLIDWQVMEWAVQALKTLEITPTLPQVLDIVENVFQSVALGDEALVIFQAMGCDLQTKESMGYDLQTKEASRQTHPIPDVCGTYLKTINHLLTIDPNAPFRDIYLGYENEESAENKRYRLKKYIYSVIEQVQSVEIGQLFIQVSNLCAPSIIGLDELKAVTIDDPSLEYKNGIVSLFDSEKPKIECTICLEVVDEDNCQLSCEHTYHFSCFIDYLASIRYQKLHCPQCRARVTKEELIAYFKSRNQDPPDTLLQISLAPGGICRPGFRRRLNLSTT